MSKPLSTQPKERSAGGEGEEKVPVQAKTLSKDELPAAQKHQPLSLFTKDSLTSFVGGGIAGAASRTVVSPLERLKIIQQVQSSSGNAGRYEGVWRSLVRMWKEEGFKGYMRGNGVNCLRIVPYSAVQFTTYEQMKKIVTHNGFELNTFTRLGSGAIAGIVSVTVTYPLDLVRARLSVASASFTRLNDKSVQAASTTSSASASTSSLHSVKSLHTSAIARAAVTSSVAASATVRAEVPGVWSMIQKVMREEGGIRALYRGLVPTALGIAPYNGINFASYELLKDIICPPDKQTTPRRLLTGALAGTISQTLTYPLDVLRRKSQMASAKGFNQYNGAIDAARHTIRNEGIRGMYRGMWPNLIKVAPAMATSFYVYETVKRQLKQLL